MAAAAPRCRSRVPRGLRPSADLRGLMADDHESNLLRTIPGLARIAAAAYWRSARWTMRTSTQAGSRVIRAAVTGQEPGELFRSTGAEIRERTRRVLGVEPRPEERVAMTPDAAEAERE